MVFLAVGKYINPRRYRQIIETQSKEKLSVDEQPTTEDQRKYIKCSKNSLPKSQIRKHYCESQIMSSKA